MRRTFQFSMLSGCAVAAALLLAQAPAASSAGTPAGIELTATTSNLAGPADQIRIEILRWSSDEDRTKLMNAWNLKEDAADDAKAGKGKGFNGKGGGKGGGKGFGGRGGGAAAPEAPKTPESSLTEALQEVPTVGYVWSSESAGYAIRYANSIKAADGSQRIVLVTNRRLGAGDQQWKPASGSPNDYDFSVIEIRLNAKGEGEGKISLTGTVAPDATSNMVAIQNAASMPVILSNVKMQAAKK